MKKILIAMESAVLTEQLEQQLAGTYCVLTCSNGLDCVELAKEFDADVLVIDLSVSGMDGISVLEHLYNCGIRPQVIAVSAHISDYVVNKLERMNVCCLLRDVHSAGQMVARIIDVAHWLDEEPRQGRDIIGILVSLGFKMSTSGFRITKLALEIFEKDPSQKITTQLYPAVAMACNGTTSMVEKAIRDSIDSAWRERNERVWRLYFNACKNGKLVKPSNGEFLARIVCCSTERVAPQMKKYG